MNQISFILSVIALIILAVNVIYLLVFSAAGKFMVVPILKSETLSNRINTLVLFPVYKSDEVILHSVHSFMLQQCPGTELTVMVIADELKDNTIRLLKDFGAQVCCLPKSDKRNKAKAINYAFHELNKDFDNCIVMDADNLVEIDFVSKMNQYFINGAVAVQAKRVAKNSGNSLSELDSFSEIINNHIFRKGQRALGFSSSLIGSGMGFQYQLFKEVMDGMDVFSGFDKELELRLLERNVLIEYAEEVIVLDEKVDNHQVFINQRRRWIYAQWHFLTKNFLKSLYMVFARGNWDYGNKVFQFMLLPRVICIGLSGLMMLISLMINVQLFLSSLLISTLLGVALILPITNRIDGKIMITISALPRVFGNMVFALITSGKASKRFLHTPHNTK